MINNVVKKVLFPLLMGCMILGKSAYAEDKLNYEFGKVNKNKVWKITFTQAVDEVIIKNETVTLIDELRSFTKLSLEVGDDGKVVFIQPPENGYKEGKNKIIIPLRLKSLDGEGLGKNYSINFEIEKKPEIKNVLIENEPIVSGEKAHIFLSSNLNEDVQYKVEAIDNRGKKYNVTDGYTDPSVGNKITRIKANDLKSGEYTLNVYMKRSDNTNNSYDAKYQRRVTVKDSGYNNGLTNKYIKFDGSYILIEDKYYLSRDSALSNPRIEGEDNLSFEVHASDVDLGIDMSMIKGYKQELDWDPERSYEHLLKINVKDKNGVYIGSKSIQVNTRNVNIKYVDYNMTVEQFADKLIANGLNIIDSGRNRKVRATRDQVIYYLNPENFMDSYGIYQFMTLNYVEGMSVEDMNRIVKGKGILDGRGEAILEGAKKYNINPAYLIAHIILETGHGRSTLANGVTVNGKTTYNMYGIQATDSGAIRNGSNYAYKQGWFTPDVAIIEGAKWVGENYINSEKFKQNTLYKMRWNKDIMWHQYSTDVRWAYLQIKRMEEYLRGNDNLEIILEIPRYKK